MHNFPTCLKKCKLMPLVQWTLVLASVTPQWCQWTWPLGLLPVQHLHCISLYTLHMGPTSRLTTSVLSVSSWSPWHRKPRVSKAQGIRHILLGNRERESLFRFLFSICQQCGTTSLLEKVHLFLAAWRTEVPARPNEVSRILTWTLSAASLNSCSSTTIKQMAGMS